MSLNYFTFGNYEIFHFISLFTAWSLLIVDQVKGRTLTYIGICIWQIVYDENNVYLLKIFY